LQFIEILFLFKKVILSLRERWKIRRCGLSCERKHLH